jgi:hypothetical protein
MNNFTASKKEYINKIVAQKVCDELLDKKWNKILVNDENYLEI